MEEDKYQGPQDSNSILKAIWEEQRAIRRLLEGRNVAQGRETLFTSAGGDESKPMSKLPPAVATPKKEKTR